MSCNYKNECPSYSGWCEGPKQNFAMCVQFLVGKGQEQGGGTARDSEGIQTFLLCYRGWKRPCKKVCQQGFSACVPVHGQIEQGQEV